MRRGRGFGTPWLSSGGGCCSDLQGGWSSSVVRDLDRAAFDALDGRRLEVVADGLTLFRGAQLAIDTTLVSPLHRDGTARRRAADVDGAALEAARRRRGPTLSWLVMVEGPDWCCWPQKWVDGGARRLPSSSPPWPRHARCPFLRFCKVGSRRRGSAGGAPSSLAVQPGHFPCPCWTSARFHRCAKFPQYTKCCGMTGSRWVGL